MARTRSNHFKLQLKVKHGLKWIVLAVLTTLLCVYPAFATIQPATMIKSDSVHESQSLYKAGKLIEAERVLRQVIQQAKTEKNELQLAIALSNLSLVTQAQGAWQAAQQAIDQSLAALEAVPQSREKQQVLAQTRDIEGQLQLAIAQPEKALLAWQQAEQLYAQLGNETSRTRARLSQAEALQVLGFYRRSITSLNQINQSLGSNSLEKAIAQRLLGNALWLSGDSKQARHHLKQSLAIAQRISNSAEVAQTLLSLGNVNRADQQLAAAQSFYEQAATLTPSAIVQVQANLNQLSLLAQTDPSAALALIGTIGQALKTLPPSRASSSARINFAETLLKLKSIRAAAEILSSTVDQARAMQDQRSEAYALGILGALYEQSQRYADAQILTNQALTLAQSINAGEIVYSWQWQLGRLLRQQNNPKGAIAAYTASIQTLQSLRSDLAALNRNAQFSFRDSVEPVYRQAVELLLADPTQSNLRQARSTIGALQLAELDNFFRRPCLNPSVLLDQIVDQPASKAAVLYVIAAPKRLDLVLKLPQQPDLHHHALNLSPDQLRQTLLKLRQTLVDPSRVREMQTVSQQVYAWLIAPIEPLLKQSGVDTLVFVLDGELRNLPMAALYDGKHYLIENYAIALNPGLQIAAPSTSHSNLQALAAGLTDPPQPFRNFPPLPGVQTELNSIAQAGVSTRKLLDRAFTHQALAQEVSTTDFNVVHLATHGKFSSRIEETYILAYDGQISVDQLGELLQNRNGQSSAIELLVLSACETAAGDNRATLGLAGVAIQSGARSTIASLWSIDDQSTAFFIKQFYTALKKPNATKAKALQQAQIALLKQNLDYPALWSPYVLVGNWL